MNLIGIREGFINDSDTRQVIHLSSQFIYYKCCQENLKAVMFTHTEFTLKIQAFHNSLYIQIHFKISLEMLF